jgi:hypothetical protein
MVALVAVFAFSAVVASAASATKPEWKGPFNKAFTSTSGKGLLETKNGAKVRCESDTDAGEITSAKKGWVVIKFKGCKALGLYPCTTAGAAESEEIVTERLLMTLGYISEPEVGVYIEPEAGKKEPLTAFNCNVGGDELPSGAKGTVIGVLTTTTNVEHTEFTFAFTQSGGMQGVTEMEGKKDTLEAFVNGGAYEKAGEETTDTLTMGMTEIKA